MNLPGFRRRYQNLIERTYGVLGGTGNQWFVHHSGVDSRAGNRGKDPDLPFATTEYASTQATANNGDRIFWKPGHAESIATATALDLAKDGVTFVSLGHGSDRATITITSLVGSTITVSADDVKIENLLVLNAMDNCTSVWTVTGNDFEGVNIETRDSGAVEAALFWTITGDRCTLDPYTHVGEGTGNQAVAVIQATGTDRLTIDNFDIDAAGSVALISSLSTANTLMRIGRGKLTQRESAVGVVISLLAGDSGFIGGNIDIRLTDDNTDPFAAIDSASNVNFIGPITVVAGDDEAGIDIVPSLTVEGDQNLIMTPHGPARVVTEAFQPAASLVPIFVPSVGKCLIIGLYFEIGTEIGAASDWKLQITTTATGIVDYSALTQMDTEKVETIFGVTGRVADLMLRGQARLDVPITVDGGATGITIGIIASQTNAAVGDAIATCLYVPMERGAIITAA